MVATAGKVPPGRTPKSTRNSKIHQELLATLSQRHLRKLRRNNELPAATTAEAKGTNNTAATRPKKRASKHQVKLTTPDMEVLESKRSVEPPNSREASAEPKDRVFSVETARGEVLATEATVDTAMATADMVTTERPKATEAAADTTMETVESTMATEATVDTTVESDPAADTTMKTESAVSTALTSIVGEAVADMVNSVAGGTVPTPVRPPVLPRLSRPTSVGKRKRTSTSRQRKNPRGLLQEDVAVNANELILMQT
ncbi:hypothetical protein PC129_g21744 [Phytophthora cactorum]|uniref:Uncharacterized protein n=1 Tax=Phytophthora cactorum TaxID=29920 RepID=A0A8T1H4Z0_9STRA|nr:hypothetical protein Pcac1_g3648 [Phytophthora cactorum]KAG3076171.1 hypothetical protein PC122_g13675 [Phytophthora cactorum]KAG3193340.1 hypothetical protein C6341_g199 [Phytophthora cactorum]KAG3206425.1 hypothetical protein PC129_g21744 [Phytophthora cactorum]